MQPMRYRFRYNLDKVAMFPRYTFHGQSTVNTLIYLIYMSYGAAPFCETVHGCEPTQFGKTRESTKWLTSTPSAMATCLLSRSTLARQPLRPRPPASLAKLRS